MRIKLTKRNIDALKPRDERYTAWDTDISGFGLRVEPSYLRTYLLKYRLAGEQGWFTIGRHGSPWTPDTARKEAIRLLGEVARGVDPAEKRNADRKAMSFAEVGDLYFAEGVAHKKASTLHVDRGRFELHLKPLLGGKRADAITRADIERLLNDVMKGRTAASSPKKRRPGSIAKGGSGAAAQCVRLASAILQFAVDRGIRSDNPARGVKTPPVRKMQRFLSEAELGRLADALNGEIEAGGNPFPVAAIRLLALTGARRSEIIQLRWRDVDFERQLLALPDSKTREKFIHLSPPAIDILVNLPRVAGNEFVVAGGRAGRPFVGVDKVWDRIRLSAGLPDVRLHDLRHTYASVGASASLGLPIIGKLLGHTQASTTLRYSHTDSG
ncbi:MAG TPA: tyrosine-type recombinase/integrase [Roseiarcus sp.]|nr:tyrosine-type recombinase/integrase [Roseiarcus sp.]